MLEKYTGQPADEKISRSTIQPAIEAGVTIPQNTDSPIILGNEIELPKETINQVLAKVQDINKPGVAFSVLGGFSSGNGLSILGNVMRDGLLGNDRYNDGSHQPEDEKERRSRWAKNVRERNMNTKVWFNITDENPAQNSTSLNDSYFMNINGKRDDAVGVIFDINDFKELTPGALNQWDQYSKLLADELKDESPKHGTKMFAQNSRGSSELNYLDKYNWKFDKTEKKYRRNYGYDYVDSQFGFELPFRVAPRLFRGLAVNQEMSIENQQKIINQMRAIYRDDASKLIPIYLSDGSLLWPVKMSVDNVKQLAEKNHPKENLSKEEITEQLKNKFSIAIASKNWLDITYMFNFPENIGELIPNELARPEAQKIMAATAVAEFNSTQHNRTPNLSSRWNIQKEYLREAALHDRLGTINTLADCEKDELADRIEIFKNDFGLTDEDIHTFLVSPEFFEINNRRKHLIIKKMAYRFEFDKLIQFAQKNDVAISDLPDICWEDFVRSIGESDGQYVAKNIDKVHDIFPTELFMDLKSRELYLSTVEQNIIHDYARNFSEGFKLFGIVYEEYVHSERFWNILRQGLERAKKKDLEPNPYRVSHVNEFIRHVNKYFGLDKEVTIEDIENH